MEKRRTVTIFKKTRPEGYHKPPVIEEIGKGEFHQWGVAFEELHDGVANFTVAIIERPDGSVVCIDPENIRFDKDGEGEG